MRRDFRVAVAADGCDGGVGEYGPARHPATVKGKSAGETFAARVGVRARRVHSGVAGPWTSPRGSVARSMRRRRSDRTEEAATAQLRDLKSTSPAFVARSRSRFPLRQFLRPSRARIAQRRSPRSLPHRSAPATRGRRPCGITSMSPPAPVASSRSFTSDLVRVTGSPFSRTQRFSRGSPGFYTTSRDANFTRPQFAAAQRLAPGRLQRGRSSTRRRDVRPTIATIPIPSTSTARARRFHSGP